MIHTIKNIKWIIVASSVCILFGVLTFFTFINQSFIPLDDNNLQILLLIDLVLLSIFFILIFWETFKVLKERKKGKLGSETSLRYLTFFSTTTLLPAILIAIFSLFLFNVVIHSKIHKSTSVPMHCCKIEVVLGAIVRALMEYLLSVP